MVFTCSLWNWWLKAMLTCHCCVCHSREEHELWCMFLMASKIQCGAWVWPTKRKSFRTVRKWSKQVTKGLPCDAVCETRFFTSQFYVKGRPTVPSGGCFQSITVTQWRILALWLPGTLSTALAKSQAVCVVPCAEAHCCKAGQAPCHSISVAVDTSLLTLSLVNECPQRNDCKIELESWGRVYQCLVNRRYWMKFLFCCRWTPNKVRWRSLLKLAIT